MDGASHQPSLPLLTEEEEAALRMLGHGIRRSAGHPFFLEGEQGDFALLITKGHVKIMRGLPPRIIDVRGPGSIVGEMGVIRGVPRIASVVAFDDVEAQYLPGARWLTFLYDHPRVMHALLAMTADMVDRATKKNVESELAIERQLAKRLVELLDSGLGVRDEAGSVTLKLSQHDLAALIGTRKLDSVKKIIRVFKASGIVETGRQAMTILDSTAIRRIADGNTTTS